MKRLKHATLANVLAGSCIAAFIGGIGILAGCGGGSSSPSPTPTPSSFNDLVGTWRAQSLGNPDGSGQVACPTNFPVGATGGFQTFCGASDTLALSANGTFTRQATDSSGTVNTTSGNWAVSGATLSLTRTTSNSSVTETATISISANKLSFMEFLSDYTKIYVKQ